jgi:iron(III) transport system permease protein
LTKFAAFRAEHVLGVGTTAVVALLVLPPLLAVAAGGTSGSFAPLHHLDIVGNTLVLAVGATASAVLIGGGLALALAPGVPGAAMLERLVVMPLYLTPLLTAIGWSWLASPHSGLVNLLLRDTLGLPLTLNVVSPGGVVLVTALAAVPLPFLLISGALRGIDAAMLEAARVHGAPPSLVLRRVTLPLLLPATLAAALLVMVQSLGTFSVPAVLGLPAGFAVATTQIYQLLDNYPPRIGDATAWGVLLLAIAALLLLTQSALLRNRSFATVTGKALRPSAKPPRAPWLRSLFALAYVALATLLPIAALLWAASVAFATANVSLMRFTMQHFTYVLFAYPKTWIAVGNSVLLGVLTASLVCLIGVAVAWAVLRGRGRTRALLDYLSMLPLGMPAMVFALGLLWVYVAVPLPIYGTIAILLIAYVTHYLPFGVRAASAALRQLHPELNEAARVTGATWLHAMRRVTLPLLRPTIISAWALLFVMAMQEVSSSILLYSSRSVVLSVAVFDLWENGNPSDVAALGFVQLAVGFVVVGLLLRARRDAAIA